MAIIRAKREQNFTIISNDVYEKHNLSWQAMGLLGYLISKPDEWRVIVADLVDATKETKKPTGREGVYNILKELEEKGYLVRKKNADGTVDYYIFDTPREAEKTDAVSAKPNQAKPNQAKPHVLINTERQQELKNKQELNCGADETAAATADEQPQDFVLQADCHDAGSHTIAVAEKKPTTENTKLANLRTKQAYAVAYQQRYGVLPLTENAKFNALVANFVKTVGADEAPKLAEFFVWHNGSYFVQRRHDFGLLVQSVQQVRTDWLRNEQMTAAKARQVEGTQANVESHKSALDLLKAKGLA